jgi:hypothetical protein
MQQFLGWQESVLVGFLKKRRKITTTTYNPQNLNTIIQHPVENNIAVQGQSSEVWTNFCVAFTAVWEGNELLALAVEFTKKPLSASRLFSVK